MIWEFRAFGDLGCEACVFSWLGGCVGSVSRRLTFFVRVISWSSLTRMVHKPYSLNLFFQRISLVRCAQMNEGFQGSKYEVGFGFRCRLIFANCFNPSTSLCVGMYRVYTGTV